MKNFIIRRKIMLRIHFLNVGHGDCTFIEFPSGRTALVDINNSKKLDEETAKELYQEVGYTEAQASLLYKQYHFEKGFLKGGVNFVEPIDPISDYLKPKNLLSNGLFRLIITHPDMDHLTGLYRLLKQENVKVTSFWDTNNNKTLSKNDFNNEASYLDWQTYQELRESKEKPNRLVLNRGDDERFYGFKDEAWDKIRILSPTPEISKKANETKNWNLHSYVLCIEYAGHKIIFGGDADKEIWDALAEQNPELIQNISVLKAPHHGRKNNFSSAAVKLMNPIWTICSVGNKAQLKKPDGSSHDAHQNYSYYTQKMVLSTRFRGNIVVEINSFGDLKVMCSHNAEPEKGLYQLL
jgi:competence protein ComEC